jgi:uncharacterized membrane protein YkgB
MTKLAAMLRGDQQRLGDPDPIRARSADGGFGGTRSHEASTLAKTDTMTNDMVNSLVLNLSRIRMLRGDLDYQLIRAAMVFTFYIFGYQKWFSFEAQQITPFIAHSPLVFWLIPAFGVRGASFFLGTTEWLFGTLILLGYWNAKLGTLGALGSIVTFLGTVTIIPFFPDAWAVEAGGFPAMYLPVAFLLKDFLFLAASFYLCKQDFTRVAMETERLRFGTRL